MIDAGFKVSGNPGLSDYGHYSGKDGTSFILTFSIASDIELSLPKNKVNSFWNGLSDYLFSGPPKRWHLGPEDEYFHVLRVFMIVLYHFLLMVKLHTEV